MLSPEASPASVTFLRLGDTNQDRDHADDDVEALLGALGGSSPTRPQEDEDSQQGLDTQMAVASSRARARRQEEDRVVAAQTAVRSANVLAEEVERGARAVRFDVDEDNIVDSSQRRTRRPSTKAASEAQRVPLNKVSSNRRKAAPKSKKVAPPKTTTRATKPLKASASSSKKTSASSSKAQKRPSPTPTTGPAPKRRQRAPVDVNVDVDVDAEVDVDVDVEEVDLNSQNQSQNQSQSQSQGRRKKTPPPPPVVRYKVKWLPYFDGNALREQIRVHEVGSLFSFIGNIKRLATAHASEYATANGFQKHLISRIAHVNATYDRSKPSTDTVDISGNVDHQAWGEIESLVSFNEANKKRDHTVVIEEKWSRMPGGLTVQNPEVITSDVPGSEARISASAAGGSGGDLTSISAPNPPPPGKKVSQKSAQQTSTYMTEFGGPLEAIKSVWACNKTLTCRIVARKGMACFRLEDNGPHYEIIPDTMTKWIVEMKEGIGSIEQPSMRMMAIIMKTHEQKELQLRKTAVKETSSPLPAQGAFSPYPPPPSTIQYFGFPGFNQPPTAAASALVPPSPVRHTPPKSSPLSSNVDTAEALDEFFDLLVEQNTTNQPRVDLLETARATLIREQVSLQDIREQSDEWLKQFVPAWGIRKAINKSISSFKKIKKADWLKRVEQRMRQAKIPPILGFNCAGADDEEEEPFEEDYDNLN